MLFLLCDYMVMCNISVVWERIQLRHYLTFTSIKMYMFLVNNVSFL